MPTVGSLFAGIGGFDLGFERAGWEVKWQVEIDPYCQRVLAKHWPDVRRHDDVKTFPPGDADDWRVDCIIGGFPCQDVSLAKTGAAGIDGDRSGLWTEYARIIRVLRPRYVAVENVPGLLVRGIDRVLGDLAALGFDAEWSIVSACALGAPHTRERLFILGHAAEVATGSHEGQGAAGRWLSMPRNRPCEPWPCWATEPDVARVAYGVPIGMVRLGAIGNAVSPPVAEWIGRRLMEVAKS
jgi:DNA (cytosine-5)-methyltransferase 1